MVPTLVEMLPDGSESRVVTESLVVTDFIDNIVKNNSSGGAPSRFLLPHDDPYEMSRCRIWRYVGLLGVSVSLQGNVSLFEVVILATRCDDFSVKVDAHL